MSENLVKMNHAHIKNSNGKLFLDKIKAHLKKINLANPKSTDSENYLCVASAIKGMFNEIYVIGKIEDGNGADALLPATASYLYLLDEKDLIEVKGLLDSFNALGDMRTLFNKNFTHQEEAGGWINFHSLIIFSAIEAINMMTKNGKTTEEKDFDQKVLNYILYEAKPLDEVEKSYNSMVTASVKSLTDKKTDKKSVSIKSVSIVNIAMNAAKLRVKKAYKLVVTPIQAYLKMQREIKSQVNILKSEYLAIAKRTEKIEDSIAKNYVTHKDLYDLMHLRDKLMYLNEKYSNHKYIKSFQSELTDGLNKIAKAGFVETMTEIKGNQNEALKGSIESYLKNLTEKFVEQSTLSSPENLQEISKLESKLIAISLLAPQRFKSDVAKQEIEQKSSKPEFVKTTTGNPNKPVIDLENEKAQIRTKPKV